MILAGLWVAAAQAALGAAAARSGEVHGLETFTPVAIRCDGTMKITDRKTKKVETNNAPRIYIIDENLRDVSFWNSGMGRAFSLCETHGHSCTFDFAPNIIMSTAESSGWDTMDVIIDRRAGTFWEISSSIFDDMEYSATCQPTDFPSADLKARKF